MANGLFCDFYRSFYIRLIWLSSIKSYLGLNGTLNDLSTKCLKIKGLSRIAYLIRNWIQSVDNPKLYSVFCAVPHLKSVSGFFQYIKDSVFQSFFEFVLIVYIGTYYRFRLKKRGFIEENKAAYIALKKKGLSTAAPIVEDKKTLSDKYVRK